MYSAAIDIGTNSIRLLVVKIEDRNIVPVYRALKSTRTGRAVDSTRRISDEALRAAAEVVVEFARISKERGCDAVYAVGTSALRDAANSDELVQKVLRLGGPKVEVISGETEAKLTFLGATWGEAAGQMLVVDIGGGSTELAVGSGPCPAYSRSIDIGAVRLKERFLTKDPIDRAEFLTMKNYIETMLNEPLSAVNPEGIKAVAVGGTATNLAAVDLGLTVYDPARVEGHSLSRSRIQGLLAQFLKTPARGRMLIPGLQPERADIIPAGTQILLSIVEMLGLPAVTVKESDILKGIIIDRLGWG